MGCTPCTNYSKPPTATTPHHQTANPIKKPQDFQIDQKLFISLRTGNIREFYTFGQKIGASTFGAVRQAFHKATGLRRAIKTIQKEKLASNPGEKERFLNEVNMLSNADHPNIVKLYESFEDEKNYHLVTEFIGGGELFDYIKTSKFLSEPIAANFMKQIFSGIAYMHEKKIAHRDIRPENLLLDKESPKAVVKIIDFGNSSFVNERLSQKCGMAYYMAPEVLREDYDEKCDVWSAGVILYILLSGKPPFYGKNEAEIFECVAKGDYSLRGANWETLTISGKSFIKKLLEYNPSKRISAKEALEDEWIQRFSIISNTSAPTIALDNFYTFRSERKLQKAVLTFITSQLMTKEESERMIVSFRKIDKNNDGKLSKEEVAEAFSSVYGSAYAKEEVEKVFMQVDLNGSGFIDYSEFLIASTMKESLLSCQNLDLAFNAFDLDGNGKISTSDLKALLGGSSVSNNEIWEELIKEVDSNGDGFIDKDEFKEMMLNLTKISVS